MWCSMCADLLQSDYQRRSFAIEGSCAMPFSGGVLHEQTVAWREYSSITAAGPTFDFASKHDKELSPRRWMSGVAPIGWKTKP